MDAWHRNWSWGAIPPPGGTPQRARYFLGQVQYAVPLHLRGLFGPSAGGIDPRWQKMAKISPFFTPCGAKPSGSGGAPPTTLILLRNQRRRARLEVAAVSPSVEVVSGGWRQVAVIAYHADGSARKLRRLSHPRLAAASTHLRPLEGSGPAALVTGCSAVGTSLSGRVSPTRRLSPSGSLRQTLPLSLISPPSIRTLGHDPNRTRCCRRLSHAVVATRCSLGPGVVYSTRSLVEGPLVSLRRCQRATGGLVRLLGASM